MIQKHNHTIVALTAPQPSGSSSLGNQLFQLSFGLYLQAKFGHRVHFHVRKEIGGFSRKSRSSAIQPIASVISRHEMLDGSPVLDSLLRWAKYLPWLVIGEDDATNSTQDISMRCSWFQLTDGYFQNHEFVGAVESEVLFRLQNSFLFHKAFAEGQDHIGVHVRCGDYMSNPINRALYGVLNADYYLRAIKHLARENDYRSIVIVSDEPETAWELVGKPLQRLSGLPVEMSIGTLIDDFCTLALSSAVVMSNSTFSWWASWVAYSQRKAQVVFPNPWFLDISMNAEGLKYPDWYPMPR